MFDPLSKINKNQIKNFKFFQSTNFKHKYDGIFIAVGHQKFINIGIKKIKSFGKKRCLFFDFKNIFLHDVSHNSSFVKL